VTTGGKKKEALKKTAPSLSCHGGSHSVNEPEIRLPAILTKREQSAEEHRYCWREEKEKSDALSSILLSHGSVVGWRSPRALRGESSNTEEEAQGKPQTTNLTHMERIVRYGRSCEAGEGVEKREGGRG